MGLVDPFEGQNLIDDGPDPTSGQKLAEVCLEAGDESCLLFGGEADYSADSGSSSLGLCPANTPGWSFRRGQDTYQSWLDLNGSSGILTLDGVCWLL